MKKVILFTFLIVVLLLVIVFVSFGQSNNTTLSSKKSTKSTVSKKPLFEVFTSSTCIPCAAFVPGIDEVLNNNPGQYSVIKYQMNWPPPGDIYFTEQAGVRRDYYNVESIPELFANGSFENSSGFDQDDFDEYAMDSTDLEIECSALIDENFEIAVEVTLEAYSDYPAGLITQIVVVEKTTVNNTGTNGEIQFHDVMMVMLPDAEGTTLQALSAGSQVNIAESFDMTQTNMEQASDLALIVFVQDNSDKSVIQSEMADVEYLFDVYSASLNVQDYLGNPIDNAEIYLSDVGLAYTDETGLVDYNGLLPGIYNYEIGTHGIFPAVGTMEVIDENIVIDVIVELPIALLYENFWYEIPEDWTKVSVNPSYCGWELGKVKMKRLLGNLDKDLMLVSPALDLTQAGVLNFELGESTGTVDIEIGTLDNPDTPENFIHLNTFETTTGWEEVSFDMSEYSGTDSYLAFKFIGGQYTECYLDNILLKYNSTGVLESSEEYLKIYPNPVRNLLFIKSESEISSIVVTNSMGQVVMMENNIQSDHLNLNLEKLTAGLYNIKIIAEYGSFSKKILKVNR